MVKSREMVEILNYRQISFDNAGITGLRTEFFDPASVTSPEEFKRVTECEEKRIVQWLMKCSSVRQIIFEELGMPLDAFYRPEIVQPFYAPGEGDLDLVICSGLSPNRALALECKRIKVETVTAGKDKINKLQDIGGGVHQANKLYRGPFAFFQTYLAIITEVTAFAQDEINIPNRGVRSHTTPKWGNTGTTTFRQIVEFPSRDKLDKGIGIIFIEVVQPSLLSIDHRATVRICVYRKAEQRDQLGGVTNRIKEIMQ
jgi:hypothetical protein